MTTTSRPDPNDFFSDIDKAQQTASKLATVRDSLNQSDQKLFDLMSRGMNRRQVALHTGLSYAAVQRRVHRWRSKVSAPLTLPD
jgi:hypothetical protein